MPARDPAGWKHRPAVGWPRMSARSRFRRITTGQLFPGRLDGKGQCNYASVAGSYRIVAMFLRDDPAPSFPSGRKFASAMTCNLPGQEKSSLSPTAGHPPSSIFPLSSKSTG